MAVVKLHAHRPNEDATTSLIRAVRTFLGNELGGEDVRIRITGRACYEIDLPGQSYKAARKLTIEALEAATTQRGTSEVKDDWRKFFESPKDEDPDAGGFGASGLRRE